jgi:hypothetical protein
MVYITSSGTMTEKRSTIRISIFSDIFWGVVNFIGLFLNSMFGRVDQQTRQVVQKRPPAFGRGGGGGGGGGGGARIKGMDTIKAQGGACAGGGG